MSAGHRDPACVEVGPGWAQDRAGRRLMVVLRAPGCHWARTSGGCTNCGFWHHLTTDGAPVTAEDLVAQLEAALAHHAAEVAAITEVDIYCSGSFFCDAEVPAAARLQLLARAAGLPAVRRVVVESRPEYILPSSLAPAADAIIAAAADKVPALEVAIGLESADQRIREELVGKGFDLAQFEAAAATLAKSGAQLGVYLLLKPRGVGEQEALRDVAASGDYLVQLRQRIPGLKIRVSLEPTFVPEGTPLHQDLLAGRYRPPSLWTVARAATTLAEHFTVHVGLSNEGMPADTVPAGCHRCDAPLRAAISCFNETQDCGIFDGLACDCPGYQAAGALAGPKGEQNHERRRAEEH